MNGECHAEDHIPRIKALSRPLEPLPTHYPTRMVPLTGVRAVVFDIYGTLLISGSGDIGTVAKHDAEQVAREALAATDICVNGVSTETHISARTTHDVHLGTQRIDVLA